MPESKVINGDCMAGMAQYPDKYFDLAIVDPPYGIGAGAYTRGGTQYGNSAAMCKVYEIKEWDNHPPPIEYFIELKRISKNQIIWGANHFISHMPYNSSCWVFWDKCQSSQYADGELAWTSFKKAVKRFKFRWNGMLQENMKDKEVRIHPTHKPIALYKWLLQNYAKQGDKILDTHLGSGSSRIAAYDLGFDFTAYELDTDYFNAQEKRFAEHVIAHGNVMFKPIPNEILVPAKLF